MTEGCSEEKSTSVAVVCAVWSRDPNRWDLMSGHLENLLSQTCRVQPVYVLEKSDVPPNEFRDYCITFEERLSIYQAWVKGIEFANCDFVMNLNLDDRLRKNAVEVLRIPFHDKRVMCVGGDWHVRFDLSNSAGGKFIEPINNYYWEATWPPSATSNQKLRLGSGTGERGTYGPATMWRKSLFDGVQYPTRFGNGELIESIADAVFWHMVKSKDPDALFRIPMIIGDYLSSPNNQAEFRTTGEHEKLKKHGYLLKRVNK